MIKLTHKHRRDWHIPIYVNPARVSAVQTNNLGETIVYIDDSLSYVVEEPADVIAELVADQISQYGVRDVSAECEKRAKEAEERRMKLEANPHRPDDPECDCIDCDECRIPF